MIKIEKAERQLNESVCKAAAEHPEISPFTGNKLPCRDSRRLLSKCINFSQQSGPVEKKDQQKLPPKKRTIKQVKAKTPILDKAMAQAQAVFLNQPRDLIAHVQKPRLDKETEIRVEEAAKALIGLKQQRQRPTEKSKVKTQQQGNVDGLNKNRMADGGDDDISYIYNPKREDNAKLDVFFLQSNKPQIISIDSVAKLVAKGDEQVRFGNVIILQRLLGSGVAGVTFLGRYGEIDGVVAIKLDQTKIARLTKNVERVRAAAIKAAPKGRQQLKTIELEAISTGQANLDDVLREYNLMKEINDRCNGVILGNGKQPTVKDLKKLGPVVGVYGVCAVCLPNGFLHTAIAMEPMDMTLFDYIEQEVPIIAAEYKMTKLQIHMILCMKALRNMNRIHMIGVDHIDPHDSNWLVNFTGIRRNPWAVDVRMCDLGMSCKFRNNPTASESCAFMATKKGDVAASMYNYPGTAEYSQWSYSLMDHLFSKIVKSLDSDIIDRKWTLLSQVSKIVHIHHFRFKLADLFTDKSPIEGLIGRGNMTFDDWFSFEIIAGCSIRKFLFMILTTQFDSKMLIKMQQLDLLPQDWLTAWK